MRHSPTLRTAVSFRLLAILAAVVPLTAFAHQYQLGGLAIKYPWTRPTAAGMPMGVAYLSITNQGPRADALVGASSPAAASVEIHHTTITDGMARMRPVAEVSIPPGATVKIEPGGIHLMLVSLVEPLVPGKSVPLTLQFRNAGSVTVQLMVESRDSPPRP